MNKKLTFLRALTFLFSFSHSFKVKLLIMPSEYKKYYKVLDLDVGASKEQVKMAFRELSQMYHPDNYARKSPEVQKRSEEKFKELSNAYQVLKDYLSEEDSSR